MGWCSRFGFFFSILIASILITGCGQSSSPKGLPQIVQPRETKPPQRVLAGLLITDTQGNAVADATVMIGPEKDKPFPNNIFKTDAAGLIELPEIYVDPLPVTIDAPGFVRATYYDIQNKSQRLMIRRPPPTKLIPVTGITAGYGDLKKDGFLDIGWIITTATRGQLAQFQLTSFLSPYRDLLDNLPAGQKLKVPTNTSIAKQKESYLIFSFTLEKPLYKMYLQPGLDYRVIATHVRFPVKSTIDGFRNNKSVFEMVNDLEFKSMGYRDLTANEGTIGQDIAVNSYPLLPKYEVTAPQFRNDQVMLAVSLVPMGNQFFPADIKRVLPGEKHTLRFPENVTNMGSILAVLRALETEGETKGAKSEIFSSILTSADSASKLTFLPVMGPPKFARNRLQVKFKSLRAYSNIQSRGTHAILSKVEIIPNDLSNIEIKTPRWDVYSKGWNEKLQLPKFPEPVITLAEHQRWEVMIMGDENSTGPLEEIGPNTIETVSHVSKTAADL